MNRKPSDVEQSAAPVGQAVDAPRRHTPLPGMYHALVTLQKRNIEALQIGEGRGLSTREMAEHLERESGMLDLYEALDTIMQLEEEGWFECGGSPSIPDEALEFARAALAKARGENVGIPLRDAPREQP
jgi:hypothetical protein